VCGKGHQKYDEQDTIRPHWFSLSRLWLVWWVIIIIIGAPQEFHGRGSLSHKVFSFLFLYIFFFTFTLLIFIILLLIYLYHFFSLFFNFLYFFRNYYINTKKKYFIVVITTLINKLLYNFSLSNKELIFKL
jgi:hypothetical protein